MNYEGEPEDDLLLIIKLLHSKRHTHEQIISQFEDQGLELNDLNDKERFFLRRYILKLMMLILCVFNTGLSRFELYSLVQHCLEQFPGRCELTLACQPLSLPMSDREGHAHRLSSGQQQCLQALQDRLGRS